MAELVIAQFPDIEFRICDSWDLGAKYGLSENGKIRWLELSVDVNEMMNWGIDVDPYTGPTPEQWEELRQHRRARVQEMIDLGVHISPDTWSEFSDAYDFYSVRFDFTDEHLNTVIEYFKTRKPDFYAEYMEDVPFCKSDRDG